MTKPTKAKRIDLRVTAEVKAAVSLAASLVNTTITSFIVQKAYEAAQEIIMEKREFSLTKDKWQKFLNAIDRPAREIPALKKLASEKTVLEKARAVKKTATHQIPVYGSPGQLAVPVNRPAYVLFQQDSIAETVKNYAYVGNFASTPILSIPAECT